MQNGKRKALWQKVVSSFQRFLMIDVIHNIIQIHNIVLWNVNIPQNILHIQIECGEYPRICHGVNPTKHYYVSEQCYVDVISKKEKQAWTKAKQGYGNEGVSIGSYPMQKGNNNNNKLRFLIAWKLQVHLSMALF